MDEASRMAGGRQPQVVMLRAWRLRIMVGLGSAMLPAVLLGEVSGSGQNHNFLSYSPVKPDSGIQ